MKKFSLIASFALFFVLGTFLFSFSASAYIDPSAMTYIVQLVVGIVIACSAGIAFNFRRIKRKFKKQDKPQEDYRQQEVVNFDNDAEFDDSHLDDNELNKMNGTK